MLFVFANDFLFIYLFCFKKLTTKGKKSNETTKTRKQEKKTIWKSLDLWKEKTQEKMGYFFFSYEINNFFDN